MNIRTSLQETLTVLALVTLVTLATFSIHALAGTPPTDDGVTTIVLDEYNGYFAARDTLVGLRAGTYDFVVTNRSDKLVGFWLQDGATHAQLDRFPLEPGETRTARIEIGSTGFRYRCPINPTPWYDVAVQ
jgi:hypothetical protein